MEQQQMEQTLSETVIEASVNTVTAEVPKKIKTKRESKTDLIVQPQVIQAVQEVPKPIEVSSSTQMMVAKNNGELVRMIKIFMNGNALPKSLDTEAKVITAWHAAASLKVSPWVAIQNMAIIHGSLSIWGQLPKALAEATGQLSDYKLIMFDKDQEEICLKKKNLHADVWGAVVQIQRNRRSKNEYYFTEPEAKAAGLFGKQGPWKDYKKVMYARRAGGQAFKFEFADALMGLSVAEYDFHEAPDIRDVSDKTDTAKLLNSTLEGK